MATDIFLKIDDYTGESQDKSHKDEIEVLSWTWCMAQGGSAHAGSGAGAGRVIVRDLTIIKHVDRSTPNLIKLCCSGKHFGKAKLVMRKAGGTAVEYFTVEMTDGIVSGVKPAVGKCDEVPTESVTINFAAFKCEYTPQGADGRPAPTIPAQWNIAKNSES